MDKMVAKFMDAIERLANPLDNFVLKVRAAQEHYESIITPEQHRALEEWCQEHQACYGIYYDLRIGEVVLKIVPRISLDGQYYCVPFNENSTVDDVQKFIDLLKLTEVHSM